MTIVEKAIQAAPEAYRYLRGYICIHRPADWGVNRVCHTLQVALCNDLNAMEQRPIQERVDIVGSFKDEKFSVVRQPSVADNPLVVGPRWTEQDIPIQWVARTPFMSSGLWIMCIRPRGIEYQALQKSHMVSTYQLRCQLGAMTDDGTTTGRVRERSRYYHVHQALIERYLSSVQAGFQRRAFDYAGVDENSQEAFELASKGLVRPLRNKQPIVYSLRCIEFDAPSFTLEIQIMNETDEYMRTLVCDLALKLRTTAALEKMRRVRYGPFTLDQALIKNHWTLENILQNIRETAVNMDQWKYPDLFGDADPHKRNLTLLKKI